MACQLLALKWNNHHSTFLNVLSNLRIEGLFCDVTVVCNGKFYSLHKLVLSTCSEYFEKIFKEVECKKPIIVVKDIREEYLEALLNYMYVGEVNVQQENLAGLIQAAEFLKIRGLAVPDEIPEKKQDRITNNNNNKSKETEEKERPAKRRKHYDECEDKETNDNVVIQSPPPKIINKPNNTNNSISSNKFKNSVPLSDAHSNEENQSYNRLSEDSGPLRIHNHPPESPESGTVKMEYTSYIESEDIKPILPLPEMTEEDNDDMDRSDNSDHLGPFNLSSYQTDVIPSGSLPSVSGLEEQLTAQNSLPPIFPGIPGGHEKEFANFPDSLNPDALAMIGGTSDAEASADILLCQYCMKSFTSLLILKRHEQSHLTGSRLLSCPYCEYQTPVKSTLTCHIRTHTGEKPFICSVCDFRSATRASLSRHVQIHSNLKPFACTHCNYCSARKDNLALHVRKQHL